TDVACLSPKCHCFVFIHLPNYLLFRLSSVLAITHHTTSFPVRLSLDRRLLNTAPTLSPASSLITPVHVTPFPPVPQNAHLFPALCTKMLHHCEMLNPHILHSRPLLGFLFGKKRWDRGFFCLTFPRLASPLSSFL